MALSTLQFRIKDQTTRKHLIKMGYSVNYVWNYCNEVNQESWKKFGKTFSAFELNALTSGCSKDLCLHSLTIQAVCGEYAKSCKQHKKIRLSWRSSKRSLGWIPFRSSGIKVIDDSITYNGYTFRFWKSREIIGEIKCGSFAQDALGRWYVNLVVEGNVSKRTKTGKLCGIDLGLKTLATLSDGISFDRANLTKKNENRLAVAQRAKKKRRVAAIHAKIRNQRKDWNHKVSSLIASEYDQIFVGNVSSSKLKKTKMAKSVSDAGWYDFKSMLAYKSIRIGSVFKEVNESFSTVTCSHCGSRTGPRGLSKLRVRDWICSSCSATHNRDVNAAMNILISGQGIVRQRESASIS